MRALMRRVIWVGAITDTKSASCNVGAINAAWCDGCAAKPAAQQAQSSGFPSASRFTRKSNTWKPALIFDRTPPCICISKRCTKPPVQLDRASTHHIFQQRSVSRAQRWLPTSSWRWERLAISKPRAAWWRWVPTREGDPPKAHRTWTDSQHPSSHFRSQEMPDRCLVIVKQANGEFLCVELPVSVRAVWVGGREVCVHLQL